MLVWERFLTFAWQKKNCAVNAETSLSWTTFCQCLKQHLMCEAACDTSALCWSWMADLVCATRPEHSPRYPQTIQFLYLYMYIYMVKTFPQASVNIKNWIRSWDADICMIMSLSEAREMVYIGIWKIQAYIKSHLKKITSWHVILGAK